MNLFFILIGITTAAKESERSWRDFVGEEYSQAKNIFADLEALDKYVKGLSRPSRQFNLVPENDISKQFELLGESVQGMRDGSFGPLNIGFSDIKIMVSTGI